MIITLGDHSRLLHLYHSYFLLEFDRKTNPHVSRCLQSLMGAAARQEPKHSRNNGVVLPPAWPGRSKKHPNTLIPVRIMHWILGCSDTLSTVGIRNEVAPRSTFKAHPHERSWGLHLSLQSRRGWKGCWWGLALLWLPQSCPCSGLFTMKVVSAVLVALAAIAKCAERPPLFFSLKDLYLFIWWRYFLLVAAYNNNNHC